MCAVRKNSVAESIVEEGGEAGGEKTMHYSSSSSSHGDK